MSGDAPSRCSDLTRQEPGLLLGRPWRRGCSTGLTARDSLPAGPSCRSRRHGMWEAREQGGGFSGIGGCSALEKRGSGPALLRPPGASLKCFLEHQQPQDTVCIPAFHLVVPPAVAVGGRQGNKMFRVTEPRLLASLCGRHAGRQARVRVARGLSLVRRDAPKIRFSTFDCSDFTHGYGFKGILLPCAMGAWEVVPGPGALPL